MSLRPLVSVVRRFFMRRALAFLAAAGLVAALSGLASCAKLFPKKEPTPAVKVGDEVVPIKPAPDADKSTKSLLGGLVGGGVKATRVVLRGVVKGGALVVESATEVGHGAVTQVADQTAKAGGRVVDTVKGVADGTRVVIVGAVEKGKVIAESVISVGEKEQKK